MFDKKIKEILNAYINDKIGETSPNISVDAIQSITNDIYAFSLDNVRYSIAHFSDVTFGSERPFTAPLHHLKKEIDEAIESGEHEEFADMMLLLLDAYRKKFPKNNTSDLAIECLKKIDKCQNRKWGKADENGVIEHIR